MKRAATLAPVVLLGLTCWLTAQEPARERPAPPVGTWERSRDGHTVRLTIQANRLQVTVSPDKVGTKPGENLAAKPTHLWLLEADYSVTKDSILFGIVTSTESPKRPATPGGGDPFGGELGSGEEGGAGPGSAPFPPGSFPPGGPPPGALGGPGPGAPANRFALDLGIDDLFRLRFRVDDGVLTLKDAWARGGASNLPTLLSGRFKTVDVKHPEK
jgi:hypothetical protein